MRFRRMPLALVLIMSLFVTATLIIVFAFDWVLAEFDVNDTTRNFVALFLYVIAGLAVLYAVADWWLDYVDLEENGVRQRRWNGILNETNEYIDYVDVVSVNSEAGFWGRLFNIGNVSISSANKSIEAVGIYGYKNLILEVNQRKG